MSSKPSSLEAAAKEVIDNSERESGGGVLGVPASPEQLDMLADENGKLPANVFRIMRDEPAKRGPGRPKGSRNKRNQDLAKLIAHKYGDPVEFQASIYAMPLDQLCQLLLVADGTLERQEQLEELLNGLAERVDGLRKAAGETVTADDYKNLTDACEALAQAATKFQGKPGDLALKALNLQMAGARSVSEYVHSKKATEHNVKVENLPVIAMPGVGSKVVDFNDREQEIRFAGNLLAEALAKGRIEQTDVVNLTFQDGRFVRDDGAEIGPDDGDEEGADHE